MILQETRLIKWLSPLVHLSSNWLSRIGVVLVTAAGVFWIWLLPTIIRGDIRHPYLGLLTFMALPAVFFTGLILIPAGIILRRRREHHRGVFPASFPPLDFQNVELRRLLIFVGVITAINVMIGGQLTYSSMNYVDSVTFCGQTCHTVMKPEFTAYQGSPHSRVECVQCHIGPGASWFVRSKLSGTYQVYAVAFNKFPRPIPTPVHSLRPARETCEQCHWPQRLVGDRLKIIPKYGEDEKNSLTQTVLLLHIGGGIAGPGIHSAHLGSGITIRYGSDESRQNIHWVDYQNTKTGKSFLFLDPDTKPAAANLASGRVMDCVDCHNRPTHIFKLPDRAMDEALAAGEISTALPFVKKRGLEILKERYDTQEEADAKIPAALSQYYQQNYPDVYSQHGTEILQAGKALADIFNHNVFPEMKVTWGTYPNNIGHTDFPGCFRCHDGGHATTDASQNIPQDCSTCHNLLAADEANPKILSDLGITPEAAQK
ncbi:MAG TPA: NapC/NirT family cytochrome c [Terriglobia bacterium]|nr:NapC/NirT family cytochrome c [Terriglobia bacterium]